MLACFLIGRDINMFDDDDDMYSRAFKLFTICKSLKVYTIITNRDRTKGTLGLQLPGLKARKKEKGNYTKE